MPLMMNDESCFVEMGEKAVRWWYVWYVWYVCVVRGGAVFGRPLSSTGTIERQRVRYLQYHSRAPSAPILFLVGVKK
eukprot:scaffold912_cov153-Amphora_coffeaeformis.AAC.4